MFFHITLDKTIQLYPRLFGPKLRDTILDTLNKDLEGTCSGRYGYVITVTHIESIEKGKIDDSFGMARFPVKFRAVVFRPFKNEVMDAVVDSITHLGFFAKVGPMTIFVSRHQVPPDMRYEPELNPPCYISEDESFKISKGSEVRIRIMSYKFESNELFAIGTINDDFLGPIG